MKYLRSAALIGCFLLIVFSQAMGQDFHFTQFYAAPLNLSPAFTGAMETTRAGVNYRKQWPGFGYDFNAAGFYYDTYFTETNIGIGLAASQFTESFLKNPVC